MSDRLEFYEVREGTIDSWEHVCLCKTEKLAERVIHALDEDTMGAFYIQHVEIVANTDLDVQDY